MPYEIGLCVLLLLVLAGVSYGRTAEGRGFFGELCVRLLLGRTKADRQYVIHNLMLRAEDGRTAQIDHIVINPRGVFVLETKNYSGRIYGQEAAHEWTQVLAHGRVKNKLYNPIKQNKTHIYHLSNVLCHKVFLTSVVVFVQGNIRFIEADGVYDLRGMRRALRAGKPRLSEAQMREIYEVLTEAHDPSITRREHLDNIQRTRRTVELGICPRCGRRLVRKWAKGKELYRCKGYPKCRFTKGA